MSKFVEFPLNGGGVIVIEAIDEKKAGSSGFMRGEPGGGEAADKAQATFEASFEQIRQSAEAIIAKLSDLSQKPDEVELNFGLRVSAELGQLVVAKAGSDSNYGITLRWRSEKPKDEKKEE
jgi:hypothetical protein